jgi:hypothetical protein
LLRPTCFYDTLKINMEPKITVFMGIDISTGARPLTFVAVDTELKPLAIGEGDLPDALAYAAGQQAGVMVAINAPARPNNGRMADSSVRASLSPAPERGKWKTLRQAEFELIGQGVEVPQTPSSSERSLPWMKRGFTLVSRLEQFNYRPYPAEDSTRQWLEVQSDAAFWSLVGAAPLPAGTLEGRLQRQLALADLDLPVPDAMEFFEEITRFRLLKGSLPMNYVLSQAEINAWLAAFTAWQAVNQPEALRRFGVPEEGVIYLPCKKD